MRKARLPLIMQPINSEPWGADGGCRGEEWVVSGGRSGGSGSGGRAQTWGAPGALDTWQSEAAGAAS